MPFVEEIELEKLCVVTLQGGGVYGLTSVGQLDRVINEFDLTPMALAGTSAGAIVAALYWSGMSPIAIRHEFESLAESGEITNLLGPFEPVERPFTFESLAQLPGEGGKLLGKINSSSDVPFFKRNKLSKLWTLVTEVYPFYRKNRNLLGTLKHRGIFSGDQLQATIQRLMWSNSYMQQFHGDLREIMAGDPELRFKHIRRLEEQHDSILFPALFITATNVRTGKIEVFNSLEERYGDTPVARAVRASGSFPFVFRPVQVPTADSNDWYVDGGVISNFPVWIFGDAFRRTLANAERYKSAAKRPWMHVGLRRGPDAGESIADVTEPRRFYGAMLSLLTGGARDTFEDRIAAEMSPARIVRQPEATTGGPKSVLDVGKITKEKVREMFLKGAWYARRELRPLTFDIPDKAKRDIDSELSSLVTRCNLILGEVNNATYEFRSNLYLPHQERLYRRFWCNMAPPGEHGFDFDTSLTGYCFRYRVPMSCNLQWLRRDAAQGKLGAHDFGMTKEGHLLVRADRTWLVSLPVFDPNEFLVPTLAGRAEDMPPGSPYHHVLPKVLDGVIYGVLNVDARIDYERLGIDPNPENSWTDARLSAIIDLARVSAARIGRQLAICFGGKERSHENA